MAGVAKGKPGLAGIGGVFRNHKGEVLYMFHSCQFRFVSAEMAETFHPDPQTGTECSCKVFSFHAGP